MEACVLNSIPNWAEGDVPANVQIDAGCPQIFRNGAPVDGGCHNPHPARIGDRTLTELTISSPGRMYGSTRVEPFRLPSRVCSVTHVPSFFRDLSQASEPKRQSQESAEIDETKSPARR